MRFSTIIALASIAVAAPLEKRAYTTTWEVEVVTLYTTVYATPAASASGIGALQQSSWSFKKSSSTIHKPTSAPSTTVVATPTPPPPPSSSPSTSSFVPPPPSTSSTVAASAPSAPATSGQCSAWDSSQSFSSSPVDCGIPVIDTVNKWRVKYGKSELTWASNLAQAAQNTVSFNKGGVTEVHPGLVDGSMGECITPGFWETGKLATQGLTPFEVGLMGWLCEVSSDPQLQASANNGVDVCGISRNVASISGSGNPNEPRGHHDIFLSDSYTKIGCWFEYNVNGDGGWPQFAGQTACDFS